MRTKVMITSSARLWSPLISPADPQFNTLRRQTVTLCLTTW